MGYSFWLKISIKVVISMMLSFCCKCCSHEEKICFDQCMLEYNIPIRRKREGKQIPPWVSNWAVTSARASVVVPQAPQLALARVTAQLDTNGGMFSLPIETFRNVIPIGIITCWTKIRGKKPSLYFKYFWQSILQSENLWISSHKFGIELKQQCQVGSWKKCEYQSDQQPSETKCMEIGSSIDEGTSVKKKTGFTYHIDRARRWPRPDINFRMKYEMSDNNSVNFWRTKMVHLFLEFPVWGL